MSDEELLKELAGRGSCFTALIPAIKGAGGEDVFADAGNEFFFDA